MDKWKPTNPYIESDDPYQIEARCWNEGAQAMAKALIAEIEKELSYSEEPYSHYRIYDDDWERLKKEAGA